LDCRHMVYQATTIPHELAWYQTLHYNSIEMIISYLTENIVCLYSKGQSVTTTAGCPVSGAWRSKLQRVGKAFSVIFIIIIVSIIIIKKD
jgi:hypothetical protein